MAICILNRRTASGDGASELLSRWSPIVHEDTLGVRSAAGSSPSIPVGTSYGITLDTPEPHHDRVNGDIFRVLGDWNAITTTLAASVSRPPRLRSPHPISQRMRYIRFPFILWKKSRPSATPTGPEWCRAQPSKARKQIRSRARSGAGVRKEGQARHENDHRARGYLSSKMTTDS